MNRGRNLPKVRDILQPKAIAIRPDFSTFDAIACFNEYNIASAPVINEQQEVIGFLSESDIIRCMGNCLFYDEYRNPTIDSIMVKEVAVANPEWDVFELENFFVSKHIRTAPVVDAENHLIGIVTRRDAVQALEKVIRARGEYKKEIKTPVELNLYERIKMLMDGR